MPCENGRKWEKQEGELHKSDSKMAGLSDRGMRILGVHICTCAKRTGNLRPGKDKDGIFAQEYPGCK